MSRIFGIEKQGLALPAFSLPSQFRQKDTVRLETWVRCSWGVWPDGNNGSVPSISPQMLDPVNGGAVRGPGAPIWIFYAWLCNT